MNENAVTQKLISKLNGIPGCRARKRHGGKYQSGEADISLVMLGKAAFIEVKLNTGELTQLQATELDKWRAAGALTLVASWNSADRLFRIIRPMSKAQSWCELAGPIRGLITVHAALPMEVIEWGSWLRKAFEENSLEAMLRG